MGYWIHEYGGQDKNRKNWRMYHCDYRADINNLPKNDSEGVPQEGDDVAHTKAKFGDQCLCLEDSTLWELRKEPNDWKEL